MVLPNEILTVELTFGPYINDVGRPFVGRVSIHVSAGRVWTPTGAVLMPEAMVTELNNDGYGSISLPATDQDGFTNGIGQAVKDWTYTAVITLDRSNVRNDRRVFQLPAFGQADSVAHLDSLTQVPASSGTFINATPFLQAAVAEAEAAAADSAASALAAADSASASSDARDIAVTASQSAAADSGAAADIASTVLETQAEILVTAAAVAADAGTAADAADAATAAASTADSAASGASSSAVEAFTSANTAADVLAAMPVWWFGTQTAYDAIGTKSPTTMYFITG